MTELTDKLNELTANFIKSRDADGTNAGADEAYKLAEFCASVFEKPFVAKADDGRECQVPHKSSQDVYRNTWNGEGQAVNCHTLRLVVAETGHSWHPGKRL